MNRRNFLISSSASLSLSACVSHPAASGPAAALNGDSELERPDTTHLETRLAAILQDIDRRRDTSEVQFAFSSPSRHWRWEWALEDYKPSFFFASITKLYVVAIIMQLRSENYIDLDAPASRYLTPGVMTGIHVLDGVDSGEMITVRQLLTHTSGISDYFEQQPDHGPSTFDRMMEEDFSWTFEDVIRRTKEDLPARFAPAYGKKAFYSDTNYQLLGKIVENITGAPIKDVLHGLILKPYGLKDTYLFTQDAIGRYPEISPIKYGGRRLQIPNAMASFGADGGLVSTASDGLAFLHLFMAGDLFPAQYLQEMTVEWRPIHPMIEYGMGIMRFAPPRYLTPFNPCPPMIGHSGASGSVLFQVPDIDLYVCGTVNQVKKRSLPFQTLIRLVSTCASAWKNN